jgi:hypothetical protein
MFWTERVRVLAFPSILGAMNACTTERFAGLLARDYFYHAHILVSLQPLCAPRIDFVSSTLGRPLFLISVILPRSENIRIKLGVSWNQRSLPSAAWFVEILAIMKTCFISIGFYSISRFPLLLMGRPGSPYRSPLAIAQGYVEGELKING